MHKNKPQNFGHKIKRIRVSLGYKQEYIASKIGISQTGYSKIETGETSLTLERASAIASALGMSLIEMLDGEK